MFVLICLLVSILFVPLAHSQNADLYYQQGMEFAKLQRWEEAKKAFISGLHQSPNDKRFPTELAGIAFRQHQNPLARAYLHRALKLDRNDNYVLEFLGTIYLLDGNLQAALLHWNKIGRPQIENIKISGNLKINPSLLDHAFVFSPLSLLKLSDIEETLARLQLLEIFPRCSFELSARSDGKFDLVFHALERNGTGDTTLGSLLSFFRGLPYLTVDPEFYNLKNRAINFNSLLRWDSDKRRIFLSISSPFASDPRYRIRLNLDGRNENWHIPSIPSNFRLRRAEASFGLDAILNSNWKVTNSITFSDSTLDADLFNEGREADYKIQLVHRYQFPEQKIEVRSFAGATVGRLFHHSSDLFSQISAGSELSISEMRTSFQFAKSLGTIPFTYEYILGVDQDSDLWLRAHNGLRKNKGALPMGRDFVLLNWEADKQIYRHPLFQVKVGPFIDSGRTYDTSPLLGSHKWLFDAGFQTKVRVLSAVTTVLVVGRDIRSRTNTFYLNIEK